MSDNKNVNIFESLVIGAVAIGFAVFFGYMSTIQVEHSIEYRIMSTVLGLLGALNTMKGLRGANVIEKRG